MHMKHDYGGEEAIDSDEIPFRRSERVGELLKCNKASKKCQPHPTLVEAAFPAHQVITICFPDDQSREGTSDVIDHNETGNLQ
jgi:hypothetical protein